MNLDRIGYYMHAAEERKRLLVRRHGEEAAGHYIAIDHEVNRLYEFMEQEIKSSGAPHPEAPKAIFKKKKYLVLDLHNKVVEVYE